MTTGTLTIIIFVAILAQVAVVILSGLYRRKQQYKNISNHTSQARASLEQPVLTSSLAESVSSGQVWEGFREFIVERREMEDNNQSICSFYLISSDGKLLPTFKPGQFLTFKLQIDDPISNKTKSVVRCYSLSDAPRSGYLRVSIKRVTPPTDQPDIPAGISSNFFHDHVQQGSRLQVKTPSGHFHLMEQDPLPIVLIGGGIGITPMLSILNTLLEKGSNREIWLYYGIRNGDEHIMKQQLLALDEVHDNFHLHVCYSSAKRTDIAGADYHHSGRIGIPLLRATLKLMHYQFYVCGPKPMMESLIPELEEWGVNSDDIYYESFGPATLIKHGKVKLQSVASEPCTITFSRSAKSISWEPALDSLLELAENNGVDVDSGCRAGSCGSCQTAVSSGETEYNQQPDADVKPGHCLLCISTPKGNITLDA
ncbi:MAG: 2Fe-2S iron-sulfur cluster binding domain-containing protein [Gammaproteobacteria bacterium]|nr:2Fe-2S iron-sulfur cluster binding domain-containing protein [Gammaproteobacteria bacterium]